VIIVGGGMIFSNHLFSNWTPANDSGVHTFMPNGFGGVMSAVSGVFFAYIGFDAVSVLAEESKNPQRDLPKGMIWSLIICTIIYILLSLVLTGAVVYSKFAGVGDPLAFIFEKENLNLPWMQILVAFCAVIAMTSVLLVFSMGQPRIWMSMSRDGLLPPAFQKIHPKFKTPSFATIVSGCVVGIPILFTDKTFVLDFTSIGTLFAFVLVCGGLLIIPRREKTHTGFNMPFVNSKFIFPLILIATLAFIQIQYGSYFKELLNGDLTDHSADANAPSYFFMTPAMKIGTIVFWLLCILLAVLSWIRTFSLIPLLGLVSCLYLLTGMSGTNWKWFGIWFAIGMVLYFLYGYKNSKLAKEAKA